MENTKQVIASLAGSLAKLEEIEEPMALAVIKDELIFVNEHMMLERGALVGLFHQEFNVLVNHGEALPQLFSMMNLSHSGKNYQVKIMEIKAIEWVEGAAAVRVHFLGQAVEILPKLRTIPSWAEYKGIKILDPDGFNTKDEYWQERLLTEEEFDAGVVASTVEAPVEVVEEELPKPKSKKKVAKRKGASK